MADKTNGDFLFFKAIPENWFRKRYHHEKPVSSKWTPYIPNYHLHQKTSIQSRDGYEVISGHRRNRDLIGQRYFDCMKAIEKNDAT